jgi:hypothetical protein
MTTPERMAGLVARWVRFYTRDLPPPIARRRIDEIDADLHDHIAHERAHGTPEGRIALGVAARMVRGVVADASWRGQMIARSSRRKEVTNMSKAAYRSAVRVALATVLMLLLPLIAMQFTEEVDWSAPDFVLAGVLVAGTGLLLEVAARKPGKIVYRAAAIAIGVAAMVLGEADDAPGLVLLGCLLIAGTVALAFRTAQPSG